MKTKAIPMILGLACLGALISCGGPSASSAPASSSSAGSAPSQSTSIDIQDSYVDIDSIDLDSGEYMVGSTVYAFDKENKKINVAKYDDYDSYKSKQGTVLYDGACRFVKVTSIVRDPYNAVHFEFGGSVYLLYANASGTFSLVIKSGSSTTSSGAVLIGEIPLFTMGNYVSDKQTQNKANEEGSYVYDSQGQTIREEFYLFLELTETKASIFVSDNPDAHPETPLHSVENYKTLIGGGRLRIKIPHKDGEFDCTLTSYSETEIKFVNSTEKRGDYSCSGTFTKIDK